MNRAVSVLVVVLVVATACSGSDDSASSVSAPATKTGMELERIADAVDAWGESPTLADARAHAEIAANLVVGPNGLGYGDRDGDGVVGGATSAGLLPGPLGSPVGVVLDEIGPAECVDRDVLGGDWTDPAARWQLLATAIDEWAPGNNTYPSLPSHPMRIVGWATLTQTADLDDAIEYAGHADIHVDVTRSALTTC